MKARYKVKQEDCGYVAISKNGKRTPIYSKNLKEAKAMANLVFAGKGGTLEVKK